MKRKESAATWHNSKTRVITVLRNVPYTQESPKQAKE